MQASEGDYHGSIIKTGVGESSQKGTPYIFVECDVTHIADDSAERGWRLIESPFKRTVYMYLSDEAWPYTELKLEQLQFNGDFTNPAFEVGGVPLTCKFEQYQGKNKERWDITYSGGGGEHKGVTSDVLRTLNAKWKQTHQAAPAAPEAPPAPHA